MRRQAGAGGAALARCVFANLRVDIRSLSLRAVPQRRIPRGA